MIYLDHAAATPIIEDALAAMVRVARDGWGNPDSVHASGRRARAALEQARIDVADYLDCDPRELRWMSSGGHALRSALAWVLCRQSGPVVCGLLEHPTVQEAVRAVESQGREVRWLPMSAGEVDLSSAAPVLAGAAVVVLSALNHELGTEIPIARLFDLAPSAWWIVDAVQAAAWVELGPLFRSRVLLTCAAQKLGGPAGAGVLRVPGELVYPAGRSEDERIAASAIGTPPWLAAIGMGAACAARKSLRAEGLARCRQYGVQLLDVLRGQWPTLVHNGGPSWLGPIVNLSMPGMDGRLLETAMDLRGVCIARTSACQQDRTLPSPVVAAAFPAEPWRAEAATRWSMGLETTQEEIVEAARIFIEVLSAAGATRHE